MRLQGYLGLTQRLHHKKRHLPDSRTRPLFISLLMCSTPVLGNRRPAGSAPCTIHPVLEGLYKNVYNFNVIYTIKYFVNYPRLRERASCFIPLSIGSESTGSTALIHRLLVRSV